MRRAAKTDTAQSGIVEAIEAEGWECFLIKLPCDLLCWHPVLDVLQWLEVKSARKKSGEAKQDPRQEAQREFLARTSCPVVTTSQEALQVLQRHYPAMPTVTPLVQAAKRLQKQFAKDWREHQATAPGWTQQHRLAAQEELQL